MLAELSIRREMAHPESYLGFLGRNRVGAEGEMKTRIINGNRLEKNKIKKEESRWGMTVRTGTAVPTGMSGLSKLLPSLKM